MYEQHFGLKSRPFGAKAAGGAVFVGPNQTRIMTSLNKGLTASDAVVTVTGPVGVGKTTIVSRALETISPGRLVAWVGRMQLAPDEVLDLLLAGFGVQRQGKGTIQRFAAFRRLLADRAGSGAQVAIVVEDAQRIGIDALVEIEALTAADTGDSNSANVILMGQPDLNKLLAKPELARLNQRNRLRQKVEALDEAEVVGYLDHCIRESGGDYKAIFESGVADIVFRCSEGVPRIINTLCETALTTAAENGDQQISTALMRRVAADAFGFEYTALNAIPELSGDPATVAEEPAAESAEPAAETTAGEQDAVVDEAISTPPPPELMEASAGDEFQVPELINDTQPVLKKVDDDPVTDVDAEIEATQTQKSIRLPTLESDDSDVEHPESEENFSLDAALSVEAEQTNVMPGITPNMDELAAAAKRQDVAEIAESPTENIPTLSNSMRIDVEKEVEAAKEDHRAESSKTSDPEVDVMASDDRPIEAPDSAEVELQPEKILEETEPGDAETPSVAKVDATPDIDDATPADVRVETETKQKPELAAETLLEAEPREVLLELEATGENEAVIEADALPSEPTSELTPDAGQAPEALEIEQPETSDVTPQEELEPVPVNKFEESPSIEFEIKDSVEDDALDTATEQESEPASDTVDAWANVADEFDEESAAVQEVVETPEPVLQSSDSLAANIEESSASDTTPKVTEKRQPDLDALEAALESAKNGELAIQNDSAPVAAFKEPDTATETAPEDVAAVIPEITLDAALPSKEADEEELRRVAEQIGAASSLEDVTDIMAETIFGSQALDEIAASVVANPPEEEEKSPVMLEDIEVETAPAANDATSEDPDVAQATGTQDAVPVDADAAKRLDMVKALNKSTGAAAPESIEMSSGPKQQLTEPPKPNGPQPEPIENQINTSMTQTLKALSSAQIAKAAELQDDEGDEDEDEDDKKPGGFFSRFRRST